MDNYFWRRGLPEEQQLELLDSRLIQLREEKNASEESYRWRGRDIYLIKKDIADTEYKRKLLYERLSVKSRTGNSVSSHSQENHNYFSGVIKDNTIVGDGTLIKFENQKNEKRHPKNWYEKPFGIVFLAVVAGVIIGGFLYLLRWN
jgi:hypothetical protein